MFFLSYLPTQIKRKLQRIHIYSLDADWHTNNLLQSHRGRPDHVRVQSSSCCLPEELGSFDLCHVTRSPPFGNVFELRYVI